MRSRSRTAWITRLSVVTFETLHLSGEVARRKDMQRDRITQTGWWCTMYSDPSGVVRAGCPTCDSPTWHTYVSGKRLSLHHEPSRISGLVLSSTNMFPSHAGERERSSLAHLVAIAIPTTMQSGISGDIVVESCHVIGDSRRPF